MDIRLEGIRAAHQAKIEKRVLGREERGVQRLEKLFSWSVISSDGRFTGMKCQRTEILCSWKGVNHAGPPASG